MTYRYRSAIYHIVVENPQGRNAESSAVWLDGQPVKIS